MILIVEKTEELHSIDAFGIAVFVFIGLLIIGMVIRNHEDPPTDEH